jgi:hypothetical protein
MPSLLEAYDFVDLGIHQDIASEIADGDGVIVCRPCPAAGTIVAIWVCADVLPAIGTLTVTNGNRGDQALITTLDLTTLTANVGASQTLGKGVAVGAGDMLRGTWTLSDIDSGVGFGCLVVIESAVL